MFHSKSNVDPFEEESLPRAFYFPTLEKNLSAKEQKTRLSPDKMKDHSETNKKDAKFLSGSNKLSSQEIPTREDGTVDGHELSSGSQFNESWPSTDKNVSSLLSQHSTSSSNTPGGNGSISKEKHSGSTLSKYVERFRHAAPASREHRDRVRLSNGKDFWWLSPPSSSSTPKETTTTSPPTSKISPLSTSDTSPKKLRKLPNKKLATKPSCGQVGRPLRELVEDEDLDNLQTRTDLLLEKSENTCSDISTPESLPKRPSSWMLEKHKRQEMKSESKVNVTRPRLAPEDDILYQWRLARRLEKAQEEAKGGSNDQFSQASGHRVSARTRPSVLVEDVSADDNQYGEQWRGRQSATDHGSGITKANEKLDSNKPILGPTMAKNAPTVDIREEPVRIKERHLETKKEYISSDRGISDKVKDAKHDVAIERDVPGICFIQDLPRHVHMMCDIVPCLSLQQGDDQRRKDCVSIHTTKEHTADPALGVSATNDSTSQEKYVKDNVEQVVSDKVSPISDGLLSPCAPTQTNVEVTAHDATKLHHPEQAKQEHMRPNEENGSMIGNVIGQVISERLFSSMSASRRCSSASELSNECSAVEEQTGEKLEMKQDVAEDAKLNCLQDKTAYTPVDDTLDFCDDDILVRLRQQADFYQEHLRNIDRILEQMED